MSRVDSKTNSIEDEERHYIGNLLDDDGPPAINTTKNCGGDVAAIIGAFSATANFTHRLELQNISINNTNDSNFDEACNILNHDNIIGNGWPTDKHGFSRAVGGRGLKSYRDVASINRSGSSTLAAYNNTNNVYSESASCESLTPPRPLRPRYSQSYYQNSTAMPQTVPVGKCNGVGAYAARPMASVGRSSGQSSQASVTPKPRLIPCLNPSGDASATTMTTINGKPVADVKGTARAQKSTADSQPVSKRGSPNLSVATGKSAAQSLPSTPASYSPLIQANNSNIGGGGDASTKIVNNKANWKKSDDFISVSYGNSGAKSRAAVVVDDAAISKSDAKSRYEVLKKIGSISAPNYENVLSAMREAASGESHNRRRRGSDDNTTTDSKRSTTPPNRGRSMSTQNVECLRSGNRNGKSINGQKESRGRTKTVENGLLRTRNAAVGPTGGFWNALRYFLFAVTSAFTGDGRRDNNAVMGWLADGPTGAAGGQLQPLVVRLFAAATGGTAANVAGGHVLRTSSVHAGIGGSTAAGRRKARKSHQKHVTFLNCLHYYSTALWRIAWSAVLWVVDLLVNFIVLLSLAVVVVFKQILSCF